MAPIKWTESKLRAEAAKYPTKKDFERGCKGGYQAVLKRGLINDLFENQRRSWDEASIRAEAGKYSHKHAFERGCNGGYQAAVTRFPGLLDEIFNNQYRSWDEEAVRVEAAKYSSKAEFERGCHSAYNAARRFGIIDELFDNQHRSWNESTVRAEAAKYATKIDFMRGCNSAYNIARWLGIIDELFDNQYTYTDNDLLYVWMTPGPSGQPWFKIGVTSRRLGDQRIKNVANYHGFPVVEKYLVKFPNATTLERHFLEQFKDTPNVGTGNGATEFRTAPWEEYRKLTLFLQLMS